MNRRQSDALRSQQGNHACLTKSAKNPEKRARPAIQQDCPTRIGNYYGTPNPTPPLTPQLSRGSSPLQPAASRFLSPLPSSQYPAPHPTSQTPSTRFPFSQTPFTPHPLCIPLPLVVQLRTLAAGSRPPAVRTPLPPGSIPR